MTIPESVKIIGVKYRIKEVSCISRDEYLLAQIDHVKQEILLDSSLSYQAKGVALLHEIIHGALFALGLGDEHNDESLVQGLASTLYQVLEENKLFP